MRPWGHVSFGAPPARRAATFTPEAGLQVKQVLSTSPSWRSLEPRAVRIQDGEAAPGFGPLGCIFCGPRGREAAGVEGAGWRFTRPSHTPRDALRRPQEPPAEQCQLLPRHNQRPSGHMPSRRRESQGAGAQIRFRARGRPGRNRVEGSRVPCPRPQGVGKRNCT